LEPRDCQLCRDFTFDQTPIFEAGGPNTLLGGSRVTVSGKVVSGKEGNGVVQFTGTYSSISWTETFENYYGFTVGTAASSGLPEPAPLTVLGFALLGLGFARRTRVLAQSRQKGHGAS
jgi:hypothetical protein